MSGAMDTTRETCEVTHFGRIAEDPLVLHVRSEFKEMPAMRLTTEQAMRLWGLDRSTCTGLLNALLTSHFLERDGTGRYSLAQGIY